MRKNKKIVCKDGFSMSVQANEYAYCTPRVDEAKSYTHVEVGFPNTTEPLLMEWREDSESHPTDGIYAYVPASQIALVCAKHGGIVSGELPPGVAFIGVVK
jgi:hypothetical protein